MHALSVTDSFPPGCDVLGFWEDFAEDPMLTHLREAEGLELAYLESLDAVSIASGQALTVKAEDSEPTPAPDILYAVTVEYRARSWGTEPQYEEYETYAPNAETAEERAFARMESYGLASEIVKATAVPIVDDEVPAEPLGAVRCGQCGFVFHPDCLVCVVGGTVV